MASPRQQQKGVAGKSLQKHPASDDAREREKLKRPTLQDVMHRTGLDAPTLIVMFKGALPPIISLAMYQSAAISTYFQTQGYLIAVTSVLAASILPRERFIQNLLLDLIFICFGSAMSLLAIWTSVQARIHTSPPASQGTAVGTDPAPYNSSQSAVCAIWLFADIWFANFVRAKLPSFNLPVIFFSILINNSTTVGPTMTTVSAAEAFVKEQLLAMLFGMGLATGVSLVVFPISSRMVVLAELKALVGLLRKAVVLQEEYLAGLRLNDMPPVENAQAEKRGARRHKRLRVKEVGKGLEDVCITRGAKAALCLKETIGGITRLAGELSGNMASAKRDIAWGELDAKDVGEVFALLCNVTIPIVAMSTVLDICRRAGEYRQQNVDEGTMAEAAKTGRENQEWDDVMKGMHESLQTVAEPIDQGLQHAAVCLGLLPRPKLSRKSRTGGSHDVDVDVEARDSPAKPGDEGFGSIVNTKILELYSRPYKSFRKADNMDEADPSRPQLLTASAAMARNQPQLHAALSTELMHSALDAIRDLVNFADEKVDDGTMTQKRLLFPTKSLLRKWLAGICRGRDSAANQNPDMIEEVCVAYGDSFSPRKDPERLPPTSNWQRLGDGLCKVYAVLGSKESAFGFRAACATMTIGILAYLQETQTFFHAQRLEWALFIVTMGMSITSGQSTFGFCCRLGASVLGMVSSLVMWYIADQKTPGVIVFLWLFIFAEYYFIKFPRFITAVVYTIITQIIIIGYELQVRRLGEAVANQTGQPYYPIYLLAPYRLAMVAAGSVVAFFWTVFPCPLTDRSWLRQDLAAMMYLLGTYASVSASTLKSQIDGTAGDTELQSSPAYRLSKARRKIFGKALRQMSSIQSHVVWQRWELRIGGRFPIETYRTIIGHTTRIMWYLTLMSFILAHPLRSWETREDGNNAKIQEREAGALSPENDRQDDGRQRTIEMLHARVETTHRAVVSALFLMSNSMLSGQSLPPFVPLPRPYSMSRRPVQSTEGEPTEEAYQEDNPLLLFRPSSDGHRPPGLRTMDPSHNAPSHVVEKIARAGGLRSEDSEEQAIAFVEGSEIRDTHDLELRGFLVIQMCSKLICDELDGLIKAMGTLVATVDFDFRLDASRGERRRAQGHETVTGPMIRQHSPASSVAAAGKGKATAGSKPP
ncbi:hypothetical protein GE09DRAFT_1139544 [Coniochaeta sp. 2T2.1]|nr:hypothetical protein GE09DRAFT_1139544 [Coniochaeta sp. 2T2.1]